MHPLTGSTHSRKPTLTDAEQHQVVRWYAQFYSPTIIPHLVKERFDKVFHRQDVYQMVKTQKWAPVVERYRQDWALAVFDVPLANKRYRLEKLMNLLERVEQNPKCSQSLKEKRILSILTQARLEMEDKRVNQTNVFLTSINQFSDEELLKRRDELLKRIQRHPLSMRRRIVDGLRDRQQTIEAAGSPVAEDHGGNGALGQLEGDGPVESPPTQG